MSSKRITYYGARATVEECRKADPARGSFIPKKLAKEQEKRGR